MTVETEAGDLAKGRVVVGVDGSPGADLALRYAAGEAARLGDVLEVHAAYGSGYVYLTPTEAVESLKPILEAAEARARDVAPGVEVLTFSHDGSPARALIDASEGADLLVVGSRGRGGFAGLLLGSVSQQCVSHAHCPVTVVPPAR